MTRLEMAQALRAHDNYIILTHRRPDGDTLGSAAGLCLGLRALGKNAWVLKNRQLTPKLAPFTEGLVTDTCPEHATVLSVDIASLGLLSFDAAELGLGDQIALAIDHHGSNDLNAPKLVEADRAACGEIILELLDRPHPRGGGKAHPCGRGYVSHQQGILRHEELCKAQTGGGADALHRALRGRTCGTLHDAEIAFAGAGYFRGRRGLHLRLRALH